MKSTESPWDDDPHLHPNSTATSALDRLSTITDYLSIPLAVGAIAADVLLIVIILKYKRLKSRTNYYLLHFNFCHVLYIITPPLLYFTISETFYDGYMDVHWYCVWIRVENFAMGLAFSFITGYGLDSFLDRVRPVWFSKYRERYPYIFALFYFGHFLVYLIAASICLKKGFSNNFNFYFLSCYFFAALLCVLYTTYEEEKMERDLKLSTPHKAYALTVSVVVLLMWMPLILFYNLIIVFADFEKVEQVFWYTIFLPEYVAYCCSMVIVWKLWQSNKQFRTAFRKVFRMDVSASDLDELNAQNNGEFVSKPV